MKQEIRSIYASKLILVEYRKVEQTNKHCEQQLRRFSRLNKIIIKTFDIKTTGFSNALKVISEGTAMANRESKIYVSNFIKTLSHKQTL